MGELDQYDYDLPRGLIAQSPLVSRVDARLLVVDRHRQSLSHHHIRDLAELLLPGDCLVLNETRVIPARLVGRRLQTGGRWEGLFLQADPQGRWRILCKTRGKPSCGETIVLLDTAGRDDLRLELAAKQSDGSWIARPDACDEPLALLDRVGRVPLPPYIRKGEMIESDRQHYQTVYARHPGAVAAPTAGLHFTEALLARLEKRRIALCRLTLHVGPGTFRPITASLAEHKLDAEGGTLGPEAVAEILACRGRGGRVVAVGTTSVRLLETAAADGTLKPFTGLTDLFIRPPCRFRAVDALLTNFHLPRTTLLVLVQTFGGDELVRRAYEEAICQQYRFYSYGDAMLIL
jgi:S-adenosylmethionine:tRNA ribosyltransferase-isomerase